MDISSNRRRFLAAAGAVACSPFLWGCRHLPKTARPPRIGFLIGAAFPSMTAAFRDELGKLGYQEGGNLLLEMRHLGLNMREGATQVDELVAANPDLIVVASLPLAIAVRQRDPAMPMVIATGPNLVGNGFAQSLARPGGYATGMDELPPGLTARRLTLLKSASPNISRVALLSTTPGVGAHEIQVADAQEAAARLGVKVTAHRASSLVELQQALDAIVRDQMDGLVNFQGALSLVHRQLIIDTLSAHRIAAIYQSKLFALSRGLMALAPDQDEQFREAARNVDRILKGARPGDLPIRYPSKYFLTINLSAARDIGLTLPAGLVQRADTVLD